MTDDPTALTEAYESVQDALDFQHGATYEPAVNQSGDDAEIQLQKACRSLAAASVLLGRDLYSSVVELSFEAMERSLEGYLMVVRGSDLADFQHHTDVYEQARTHGPISRDMAQKLEALYANNRTDYYYDNAVPTREVATSMLTLATELHRFVVAHSATSQFRRYCSCEQ